MSLSGSGGPVSSERFVVYLIFRFVRLDTYPRYNIQHFTAPYRTYSGLIFLTEHIFLLPNAQKNSLDIFRIPSTPSSAPTTATPLLSLLLPVLASGRTIGGISCRAEPNPIAQSSVQAYFERKRRTEEGEGDALKPTRGFLASAEEAICTFTIRVLGVQLGGFHFGHIFTFVVHRRRLVDVFEEFEREREREVASSKPKACETPAREEKDGRIASVERPAALITGDDVTHGSPPAPASDPTPTKPYKAWGPSITRWFNADGIPTRWITTTAGQRYVLIADVEPETSRSSGYPYVVLDFGKEAIRRMLAWTRDINERIASIKRRRGNMMADESHEDRLEGALSAADVEEDEGSLGDMDLGDDEWAFHDTDLLWLDHAASPNKF